MLLQLGQARHRHSRHFYVSSPCSRRWRVRQPQSFRFSVSRLEKRVGCVSLFIRPGALIAGAWAAMQYMGEEYVILRSYWLLTDLNLQPQWLSTISKEHYHRYSADYPQDQNRDPGTLYPW